MEIVEECVTQRRAVRSTQRWKRLPEPAVLPIDAAAAGSFFAVDAASVAGKQRAEEVGGVVELER